MKKSNELTEEEVKKWKVEKEKGNVALRYDPDNLIPFYYNETTNEKVKLVAVDPLNMEYEQEEAIKNG